MPSETREEPLHYGPGRLQTYTIWRTPSPTAPTPSLSTSLQQQQQQQQPPLWILYVHGGAWRDPLQSSANILPTLHHLTTLFEHAPALADPARFAGVLSIDYRLSPYPAHPTAPSDPADDQRNVRHPEHVRDLAAAVAHVKREHNVKRWVGVGHSCGATMLLHYIAGIGLSPSSTSSFLEQGFGFDVEKRNQGLEALILLEGIYSLPRLLTNHEPPSCPEHIAQIYRDLARGAFGEDPDGVVYENVSPVAGDYKLQTWVDGKLIIVGYSGEDELVEREQGEVLMRRLEEQGWSKVKGRDADDEMVTEKRVVELKELKGTHDFVWRDGRQIAGLIAEVVGRL
ncbi:alpha/beta-hydrolase [Periconia macrospinosa]|uniref:Alpha/beta-hydrolase n=1 Tax=Periconia macrospinosa TaxID=97972 RepID=A0A2V1EAC7_9PLEO|nr:alpha/beta-hydrolase [Periconia macrospinosa]